MNMLRRGLPLALAATVSLGLTACGDSNDAAQSGNGTTTIRVASNSNSTALPFWVAQHQNFFKDQGLNVTYTKIENIATLPPALGSSFDIVLSTPTLAISSTAQGIPVVEVTGSSVESEANPGSFVMAGPGSGITDVKQLGGKTIGVLNETGTLHVATMYWLQKEGVDLHSLKIVQVDGPSQADQLKSGRINAVETVAPFSGQIQAVGGTVLGWPYRALSDEITPIYWASRKDWADKNNGTIKKFTAALNKAGDFISAKDADARKILQEETGFPPAVVAKLKLQTYDTAVRPQDVELWLKAMKAATGFKGDVNPAELVHKSGS
jgi:ABC-type nitrate/sulfonate/bicarbonate transport system substrate-binding protein